MRGALIVAVALVTTVAAEGQVRVVRHGDDRLSGIREIDVVVTTQAATPAACTPDRATLQTAAVTALRQAGVRATVSDKAPSWFYSLVIDARSAGLGGSCATAISTELVAQVQGIPDADREASPGSWGSLLVGAMPLVRAIDLVTATAQEHDAMVTATLRTQVAAIAAKLRAANP